MKTIRQTTFRSRCGGAVALAIAVLLFAGAARAQVPLLLNYQGRIAVGTTNFNGTGQFKFALVNTNGTTTFWSNDGTSTAGSQPTGAVSLAVTNGLYSVLLGDTTLANMTATIPGNLFNNLDVRLRVWFNDGTNGSQLLSPDQRIGSVGYAGVAGTVPDNAITTTKISTGAVQANNIGTGAVTSAKLAGGLTLTGTTSGTFSGSLTGNASTATSATTAGSATNFTGSLAGQVTGPQGATQLANGAVTAAKIDPTAVQRRVTGTAPAGSFLTGINQDGTVTSADGGGGGGGPWLLNGTNAYYNGGSVGIGTSSPLSRLHISGVSDAVRLAGASPFLTLDDTAFGLYSRIQAAGAGMTFKTQGAVTGSNPGGLIHLDGTGVVGIGTTTPAHRLSIADGPSWTSAFWVGAMDLPNASAIAWRTNTAGQRFGMGHTNDGFFLFRTASDPATTVSPANYDFFVGNSGNIGIGTNTPTHKLQVNGNIRIDGDVGIGTSSPGARLHVHTSTANAGDNTALFSAPNLGANFSHIHYGTTGDWFIRSASASGKVILQDTGGGVGIGTTVVSAAKLAVNNTAGAGTIGISSTGEEGVSVSSFSRNGQGVSGSTVIGVGVYGNTSGSGYAGFFNGKTEVRGVFSVVGTKNFKIDHPLDPANKYLVHAAIESSEVLNLYSGNAILDANGHATIRLPDWFTALNQDFRYQLTAIGGPAPNLHVVKEISGNEFKIGGGQPGSKVSWQVTACRNDTYMQAHPLEVEQTKPEGERGTCLHPEFSGQPGQKRTGGARVPRRFTKEQLLLANGEEQ